MRVGRVGSKWAGGVWEVGFGWAGSPMGIPFSLSQVHTTFSLRSFIRNE